MIKFLSLVPVLTYIFKDEFNIHIKEYINLVILLLFIYIAQENNKESLYLLISILIFNFMEKKNNNVIEIKDVQNENLQEPEIISGVDEKKLEEEPQSIATRDDIQNQDPILYGFNFQSSDLI